MLKYQTDHIEEVPIKIDDQVAVYRADAHKWIRGVVKARDKSNSVYLWCIDYGFPLSAKKSEIIPLPKNKYAFRGKQTIHIGSISDCVPIERRFDFFDGVVEQVVKSRWSLRAIEEFENIVHNAKSIEFKDVKGILVDQQMLHMGRLMIQMANGTEINALKM